MDRAAAWRAVGTVVALLSLGPLGACGSDHGPPPGADLGKVGPSVMPSEPAIPSTDPTVIPAVPSAASGSASANPAEVLRATLAQALRAENPLAAGTVTVEQRRSAENQLVVTWTVSDNPDDPGAKQRVRLDAIRILTVAKQATIPYGSVLLVANAPVRGTGGNRMDVQVVRAKYTQVLIRKTDFATVPPDKVLTLPDDKPAEIHPSFR
jgi:hypothetical protein